MKICIVAAGLATRLQPLTNYIPKFLINTGKHTGLIEMIKYWSVHSSDFTIIVHPKYEELTRAYFDMYFKNSLTTLTIKTCETALGTAHTIDTCLGDEYTGDDVLFTWCDVIPQEHFSTEALRRSIPSTKDHGTAVFTVDNGLNRYKYLHNTLVKAEDGDVIGIYYVKNYRPLTGKYVEGQDFADVLSASHCEKFELSSVIDFGDKPKLFEVLKNADEAREFNSVSIGEKFVHKKALNSQGCKLIAQEIDWYKAVDEYACGISVPKIYQSFNNDEMVMSRINGVAIHKIFKDLDIRNKNKVLCNVVETMDTLHSSCSKIVGNDRVMNDVKKEAYTKLLTRYSEIENVINAFGRNIDTVNGVKIEKDPKAIIERLFAELKQYYSNSNTYSLIHGDLQMSNTMIDPNTFDVFVIDPRGVFGDTSIFGLPDYDWAKLLYSLSGYDLFNYSTSFHLKNVSDTEIEFDIPTAVNDNDLRHLRVQFTRVHYLWLAVIWIGLAGYIKNNPIKSVAAHYHGLALATKFINQDYTYC